MRRVFVILAAVFLGLSNIAGASVAEIPGNAHGKGMLQTIPGGDGTCDIDKSGEKRHCPLHGEQCTCPPALRGENCPFMSKTCRLQNSRPSSPRELAASALSYHDLLTTDVVTPVSFENVIYVESRSDKEASGIQKPDPRPPRPQTF